ncbi:MAG: hypothetical protein Q4D53_02420 [Leptotrichiaceae bacterium]|nr:hypothetical protein [Leptotrichiaceae bacterium]
MKKIPKEQPALLEPVIQEHGTISALPIKMTAFFLMYIIVKSKMFKPFPPL